jgi:hypothetical protein
MSRTYKHVKREHTHPEQVWDYGRECLPYQTKALEWVYNEETGRYESRETKRLVTRYYYVDKPGVFTKKRKEVDTEWHWMSTPSWWTRLTMNKPQRRKGRVWERKVLFQELEEVDPPGVGHKPHQYYY